MKARCNRKRPALAAGVLMGLAILSSGVVPNGAAGATVPPPTALAATVAPGGAGGTATLTWAATGNPKSFTIQKMNFTSGLVSYTVAGSARSTVQAGLAKGTYYYRIRANDAGGASEYSPALEVTVP